MKETQPNRYRYGKRLYHIWIGMRRRCENPRSDAYERYGGRGITVCDQWQDYEAFAQWALSSGYTDELTIERKNVNAGYCPENCTWITRPEQARNRRNNTPITYNGVTKTAAEWARELGLNKHAVLRRIEKGMSVEEAVTRPKIQPRKATKAVHQYCDGCLVNVHASAKAAAEKVGGNPRTIKWACNQGGKRAYGYVWKYGEEDGSEGIDGYGTVGDPSVQA